MEPDFVQSRNQLSSFFDHFIPPSKGAAYNDERTVYEIELQKDFGLL